jgi:hypothetical protein
MAENEHRSINGENPGNLDVWGEKGDDAAQLRSGDEMGDEMVPSRQDWRRLLPGLLISAASLVIVLYLARPNRLVDALRIADYRLAIGGGLFTLLWLLVRGMGWRTLLQDKVTLSQTFFTLNEGYLLNNFLPLRMGEVGRAYLLGRKSGLGFWRVLSSILLERGLDMLLTVALLLGTLPFVAGVANARGAGWVGCIVCDGSLPREFHTPVRAPDFPDRVPVSPGKAGAAQFYLRAAGAHEAGTLPASGGLVPA